MKRLLLLLLVTIGIGVFSRIFGQGAAAVYNDFSPAATRGITIGTTHCYIWGKLGTPYASEAACWENGKISLIEVATPGQALIGYSSSIEGTITFFIFTDAQGIVNYEITGTPATGLGIYSRGTF